MDTTILFVGEDKNLYRMLKSNKAKYGSNNNIFTYLSKVSLMYDIKCNLVIIDYSRSLLESEFFIPIFNLKQKFKVPILAVLEKTTTRNKLNILNYGAEDFIERPYSEDELFNKIQNLLRQERVCNRIMNKIKIP